MLVFFFLEEEFSATAVCHTGLGKKLHWPKFHPFFPFAQLCKQGSSDHLFHVVLGLKVRDNWVLSRDLSADWTHVEEGVI